MGGEGLGELFTRAPVRPSTEMSVAQVDENLLAARPDTAGERHRRGGRTVPGVR